MKKLLTVLLFFTFSNLLYAQQVTVSGTVFDEQGLALPGVSVTAVGASYGVVTNLEGKYTIKVSTDTKQLSFSFISYLTQTVNIGNQKSGVDVILRSDLIGLDEVVVVGYGSQKKANLTGAVTSVKLDEVEGRALTSVDQLLQGKVAGVGIVQNSGRPGDDMSEIRIRGISSIDNNNEPLVIIDGIQGNINDVSPNDIASVSVLKDAASASIYGSRASAGVIVIETKKGAKSSNLKVDYNGTLSTSNATRLPETVSSYDYVVLLNEAQKNMGLPPRFTDTQVEGYKTLSDPLYANTNWYDVYFQQAQLQNHYIALRGGDKNYRFSNSVSYKDQTGVLLGTGADRLSFNSNLSGSFFDNKVRVWLGGNGYKENVNELISTSNSVIAEISGMAPLTYVRSVDETTGLENLYGYNGRFLGAKNLGGGINNVINNLNTRASLEIEPIKNLVGKFLISNNRSGRNHVNFTPELYTSGDFLEGSVNKRISSLDKWFSESNQNTLFASLTYDKKIGSHNFKILAAHEKLETIYKYDIGSVRELSSNSPIFNFGDPNTVYLGSSAYEYATSSYFGRLNYDYKSKYLFEFNMRRDGSSRFAADNKWGNFPSVSAGWRISEEEFMDKWKFVNLKLRASWGRLGNQNIYSQYAFADQMSGQEYYTFGNTVVPGRGTELLANKDTRWETTEQTNIGLDLVLWNRLSLEADVFNKKTYDILARVTIPPSLGVSSLPYQNVGTMTNKGLEVNIAYKNPTSKNKLNYSVSTNFTFLKNELTNLGDLPFIDHIGNARSVVGQPFSSFYGYKTQGIFQVNDFTWENDSDPAIPHYDRTYVLKPEFADQSSLMDSPAPGDVRLVDYDGNGTVTPDDRTLIGNPLPKFQYGVNVDLNYKQFGLNVIAHGVQGADAYMNGRLIAPFFNTNGPLRTEQAENRWTFENPSNEYHRIYVDKTRDALVTDYNIYNASFFRLKSVQFSYSLPQKFVKKYKIDRCRLFFNAENILLITPFVEGFDPERSYRNVTASFYPQIASYTLGLNLNF